MQVFQGYLRPLHWKRHVSLRLRTENEWAFPKEKLFGLGGTTPGGGFGDIHIHIGSVDSDERADDFARKIEAILRPQLPPPTFVIVGVEP